MLRAFMVAALLGIATAALAQRAVDVHVIVVHPPTEDELAVSRLPEAIRAEVAHLPARQALRRVELADQQLLAVGIPHPGEAQRVAMLRRLAEGRISGVPSASAGATPLPPLSPLVGQ